MKTEDSKLIRLTIDGKGHSGITKNLYRDVSEPDRYVLDVHKDVKGSSDVTLPGKIIMAREVILSYRERAGRPVLSIEVTGEDADSIKAWVEQLTKAVEYPELRLEYVFVGKERLKRQIIDPSEYVL